jgi:hypothetical protein
VADDDPAASDGGVPFLASNDRTPRAGPGVAVFAVRDRTMTAYRGVPFVSGCDGAAAAGCGVAFFAFDRNAARSCGDGLTLFTFDNGGSAGPANLSRGRNDPYGRDHECQAGRGRAQARRP